MHSQLVISHGQTSFIKDVPYYVAYFSELKKPGYTEGALVEVKTVKGGMMLPVGSVKISLTLTGDLFFQILDKNGKDIFTTVLPQKVEEPEFGPAVYTEADYAPTS